MDAMLDAALCAMLDAALCAMPCVALCAMHLRPNAFIEYQCLLLGCVNALLCGVNAYSFLVLCPLNTYTWCSAL